MIDEFQEFAYLQENPTYQQDWEKAFRKNHSELTPEEIKQFIESIEGNKLAQKYGLVCAYYYGKPLGDQLRAIYHVDLDKAVQSHIPIFKSFEHLYCSVRVIPHAPAQWLDPDRQEEIEEDPQRDHFLHRSDALMDKSPHLKEKKYLTVEIDITRTDSDIFPDLRALLAYYRDQIGPVKQGKPRTPDYAPLKVWKLVAGKLGKPSLEYREAKSILWQVAGELDTDQNAYDLWSEKPETAYKEDSQNEIYKKLQRSFKTACLKILSFSSLRKINFRNTDLLLPRGYF